ncbi:NHL repeat containing protein, partial [Candidatus Magnetomorum sp. HK-1]
EDSNEFLYLSTIRHEPYFSLYSDEHNYLTTDQDGNIVYSFDVKLVTFSKSGEFVSEFGEGYGTGNYQFDDNWSAAFDSNGKMYVADYYNHRVMVYTSDKVFDFQIGTTDSSGNGNGEFNKPVDVAVNSYGVIYVVDQLNHRVQRFSSTGEYYGEVGTGVSGNSNGQFDNPTSIAIVSNDMDGRYYVADSGNHRIQIFSMMGYESSFTLDNQDSGRKLYQIALDSNGKLYVAYAGSNCGVQVYDNSGTFLYNIGTDASPAGVIGYLKYAKGVTIDNDDNIYISETNDGSIHKFSNDGTPIFRLGGSGVAPGDLSGPAAVDIDSNGNIFILEKYNARISVFTSSEAFSYSIYYTGSSNDQGVLNYPDDLDISNGKVYVADTFNSRIQVFNSSSGAYDYSIDCGGMPKGIKVDDSSGKIYASIEASDIIKVYSNSGNFEYTIGSGNSDDAPGSIDGPRSMDIDSDGNIYVAESNNDRVSVFSSSGVFQYSITYNFDYPIDVAVDNDKNIYVLDSSNGNIKAFSSDRKFKFVYGTSGEVDGSIAGNNLFSYPTSLVADNGKIYVADMENQRVQIFSYSISSYYVNDARIGIGTSTPDETLEVVGSVKIVDGNQ